MPQVKNNFFKNVESVDVLCIYGQSSSKFINQLKKWLSKKDKRKIIFLEDDKEKYQLLKKQVLKDFDQKNVKSIFIKDLLFEDLKKIAWENVYLNLQIIKAPKEQRAKNFNKISSFIKNFHLGANVTSYVYSDFGIKNFENVYNNLLQEKSFSLFEPLKNTCSNIPAIIAGAGPSLENDLDDLKKLYDKALIFASGSSISFFSKNSIRYHFSASVDQNSFFKKFKNNHLFENNNIFFYQNQINCHNLSIVDTNKVLLADDKTYPLEKWLYEKLDIKQDDFEAGWTVTTFLIKIAYLLGCNPIIFVGFDLCYKKEKYAKGALKDNNQYDLLETKDKSGKKVFTQKDWLLAKKWIEDFVKDKKTTFINASQNGLKLENIKDIKLKDMLKDFNKFFDLQGFIHSLCQNQKILKLDNKKVKTLINQIQTSFKKVNQLCDEYLLQIEKQTFQDINLLKLQTEIVYTHLLDPLWQIWQFVIKREILNNEIHILINKLLFFKNVIFEHLNLLGNFL